MDYRIAKEIFDDLYQDIDGYGIARRSKARVGRFDRFLTYGEIAFESFAKILRQIPDLESRRIFYDLGSGVGKPVIAAALRWPPHLTVESELCYT